MNVALVEQTANAWLWHHADAIGGARVWPQRAQLPPAVRRRWPAVQLGGTFILCPWRLASEAHAMVKGLLRKILATRRYAAVSLIACTLVVLPGGRESQDGAFHLQVVLDAWRAM